MNTFAPANPRPPDIGSSALELCQRCAPGQQAGVKALVAWQSEAAGSWRLAAPDGTPAFLAGLVRPGGITLWSAAALGWRAAPSAHTMPLLGRLDPRPLLAPGLMWLDLGLVLHHNGAWQALALDWGDDDPPLPGDPASDGGAAVWLAESAAQSLAAQGLHLDGLREASARPGGLCWAVRRAGTGVFISGLLDLGWNDAH